MTCLFSVYPIPLESCLSKTVKQWLLFSECTKKTALWSYLGTTDTSQEVREGFPKEVNSGNELSIEWREECN